MSQKAGGDPGAGIAVLIAGLTLLSGVAGAWLKGIFDRSAARATASVTGQTEFTRQLMARLERVEAQVTALQVRNDELHGLYRKAIGDLAEEQRAHGDTKEALEDALRRCEDCERRLEVTGREVDESRLQLQFERQISRAQTEEARKMKAEVDQSRAELSAARCGLENLQREIEALKASPPSKQGTARIGMEKIEP